MHTADGAHEPVLMDNAHTYIVNNYAAGATLITEPGSRTMGASQGPAMILRLHATHNGRPELLDIVFASAGDPERVSKLREDLLDVLQAVRDGIDDPSIYDEAVAIAHAANEVAGFSPGAPPATCAICGRRIFGPVAIRGACHGCMPDLPDGDPAPLPDLRWPQ